MRALLKLLTIFLLTMSILIEAQQIRPIRDDIGFCWKPNEMDTLISFLSIDNPVGDTSGSLIGGISPHDDYLYAGRIYFPLHRLIKCKEVVIFGVTHGSVRKEINNPENVLILDEYEQWRGPYGNVPISPLREVLKKKLPPDEFLISNKAHSLEHSIEAMIPFLQYYNRDIKITPIMVTRTPIEKMKDISAKLSGIISEYMRQNNLRQGKDIFFLISNDADHYGADFNNTPYGETIEAHDKAVSNDKYIIEQTLQGEINPERIKQFIGYVLPGPLSSLPPAVWCGSYAIALGLMTINNIAFETSKHSVEGKLLKYSDTFTEKILPVKNTSMGVTAVCSLKHWCGFFSMGIYLKD